MNILNNKKNNNKLAYLSLLFLIKANLIYCAAKITTEDNLDKNKFVEAAFKNDCKTVKKFLEAGIDTEFISDSSSSCPIGHTALTAACYNLHLKTIKLLLQSGANANTLNSEGHSHNGTKSKFSPLLVTLYTIRHYLDDEDLDDDEAIEHYEDGIKIIKLLIKHKADINFGEGNRETPLTIATSFGIKNDTELIEILIKAGAEIDVEDQYGETPLKWAIIKDLPESIKLLLAGGAHFTIAEIDNFITTHNSKRHMRIINKEKIIKLLENELIKRETFVKSLKQEIVKELAQTSAGQSLIPPILDMISDYTIRYEDIPVQDKLNFSATYSAENNNKDQKVNVVKLLLDSNKRKDLEPFSEDSNESSEKDNPPLKKLKN